MASTSGASVLNSQDSVRVVHSISDSDDEETSKVSESSKDIISDTDSEEICTINKATKRKIKNINETVKKAQVEMDLFGSDSDNDIVKKRKFEHKVEKSADRKSERTVYDISTDEMSSEDETKDKPMCPYGLKCYRKNPSHFEEFDHPSRSPSPSLLKRDTGAKDTTKDTHTKLSNCQTDSFSNRPSSLGMYFTKVSGIANEYNGFGALNMRDILSPRMGNLQRSAQFNYCIDVDWVVSQYPPEFKACPLTIVHGSQRGEKADLDLAASKYDHVRMCQARMDIPYGTHHTKMMLLVYETSMRVVIHTANLVQNDWHQKTQGGWVSPVFSLITNGESGESKTHFKADLIEYLSAYNSKQLSEWIDIVKLFDMSAADVFLIGSIPGRHTGSRKSSFGHLKLRKVLQEFGPRNATRDDLVVGQFSSVGSMGANKENWLCAEWLTSLGSCRADMQAKQPKLKLIFPTRDNIRLSLEGYPAGQSVPYSASVAKKQIFLHQFFHQWRSEHLGRSRASPHIKTFLRTTPDCCSVRWLLLTSCNLSKAAWGAFEKQQSQLFIRSYELGVLFLPQFVSNNSSNDATSSTFVVAEKGLAEKDNADGKPRIVVPFDLPPVPYGPKDQPWIWDIPYVKQPDSHGNMWCPR